MSQFDYMNHEAYERYVRQQAMAQQNNAMMGCLGQSLVGQIQGGQKPQQPKPYSVEPETRSNDELLLLLEDLA